VWCPSREGINDGERQNKNSIFSGPSALFLALIATFQQNYHNNQLLVTPNEMFGLYCSDNPLLFLSDLSPLTTHFSCNFADLHVIACCLDLIAEH